MTRLMLACSLTVLVPRMVFADVVTFTLNVVETAVGPSSGTFELFASADTIDNAGIASYGVQLTGVFPTLDHKSPRGTDDDGKAVAFNGFPRSPDGDPDITGSQDTFSPGILVYEMGQTGGDLADFATLVFAEQQVYGAPLLIADGTWTGVIPSILTGDPPIFTGANIFQAAMDGTTKPATIDTMVNFTPIPEPSIILMGLVVGSAFGLQRLLRRAIGMLRR